MSALRGGDEVIPQQMKEKNDFVSQEKQEVKPAVVKGTGGGTGEVIVATVDDDECVASFSSEEEVRQFEK